jgi:pimeloyl-ACP methyl ester carboxylesterase
VTAPHRIGWVVAGSLATGVLGALLLTVGVFGGAQENVMTGSVFLAFAAGWLVLMVGSSRWTDQPQRWAIVPAVLLALIGALFFAWPGIVMVAAMTWILAPLMLGLALWMWLQAKASLRSRTFRWLLNPLFAVMAIGSVAAMIETAHERSDRRSFAMSGELVSVGRYRLHITCTGSGSPTVVLIGGAGELSAAWGWIAPAVARDTRVCIYDRAGRGWSERGAGPQDGIALAHDLHALLDGASVTGPIVLAGHSFGGLYARVYAEQYPAQVAGMVLLDATHPGMFTRLAAYPMVYEGYRRVSALFPSLARFGIGRLAYRTNFDSRPVETRAEQRAFWSTPALARNQLDEWTEAPIVMRQAGAARSLGTRPLIVVTAVQGAQHGWLPLQDELAALSSNSVHRLAVNSTHIALVDTQDGAAISIQAIHDVVVAVRSAQPLRQP